ncbi:hypothetical protein OG422_15810 [Streptomyces sp. NBC_01525]|uniref:hypothetical protein n=1 Tax=Streptomyces sp. NBC_01525 TaxID=2903893 RepID=UPI003865AC7A
MTTPTVIMEVRTVFTSGQPLAVRITHAGDQRRVHGDAHQPDAEQRDDDLDADGQRHAEERAGHRAGDDPGEDHHPLTLRGHCQRASPITKVTNSITRLAL